MLEEGWEQALRVHRLTPLPVRFVCFLCVAETVISELAAPTTLCPAVCPSGTVTRNKPSRLSSAWIVLF